MLEKVNKADIILVGGGGHCHAVIDVIEAIGRFNIAGIIDHSEMVGKRILNYPVIGTDDDIVDIVKEYHNFFITVGQIKSAETRSRIFGNLKKQHVTLPVLISPLAYVSRHAVIGEGTVVMHHAFVNANASIGQNCIINTNAIIEHDAIIRNNCHVSTGAILNGKCVVKENTFIGSNSVAVQDITVEANNIIASGSVIIHNTEPAGLYAGNPAVLKKRIS